MTNLVRDIRRRLLAHRGDNGMWTGRLSDSALATATAVFTLGRIDAFSHRERIERGLKWLSAHQNPDGGWGDTVKSESNISTTLLVWSAFTAANDSSVYGTAMEAAEQWIRQTCGSLDACDIIVGVEKRYGADRTFAVPILTMCLLAGRLGEGAWRSIPRLPYELAILPRFLFKLLRLGIVSYALPALIAIGQAIDFHRKGGNIFSRMVRRIAHGPTLRLLEAIQPESGGFLEATPLTAFVTMSLASMGLQDHPVVRRGVGFLISSMRPEGSWPIDTDLSTWVTTLSIRSIGEDGLSDEDCGRIAEGLLCRQQAGIHPYTAAEPGGWSWTDKSGGVPDADDAAGAVAALHRLKPDDDRVLQAAMGGIEWLMGVQNSDGGIATFCRGWGKLEFDRSAADLTAHALAAWGLWLDQLPRRMRRRVDLSMRRAMAFLLRSQKADGSWEILWFGNEHTKDQNNPVFGTARVLGYLSELPDRFFSIAGLWIGRAVEYLHAHQDDTGGWGACRGIEPTIEETAVTIDALSRIHKWYGKNQSAQSAKPTPVEGLAPPNPDDDPDGTWTSRRNCGPNDRSAIQKGIQWLMEKTENGTRFEPAPIGLYFAKLWYSEDLYPLIFSLGAVNQAKTILF